MEEFQFQFEKLNAWQEARKLVVNVYRLMEKFPKTENYALCDQLRRAAISVSSNIAEGTGRMAVKEQIHFLEIAFGSLMEVYCQLQIAVTSVILLLKICKKQSEKSSLLQNS